MKKTKKCRMTMSEEKGITLIALIITIIVLLILAVVSINIAMNEGLIIRSKDATEESRGAAVQEQKDLWENEKEIAKYDGTTAKTLDELLTEMEANQLITAEEKSIIEETGKITIGSKTIEFIKVETIADITDYLYEENSDGTLTITGVTGTADILKIPAEINGKSVSAISEMAFLPIDINKPKDGADTMPPDTHHGSPSATVEEKIGYYDSDLQTMKGYVDQLIAGFELKENANMVYTTIDFSESNITEIQEGYNPYIEKIILSNKIKTIMIGTCPNLRNIDIPDGVTQVFLGYLDLRSITLPKTVTQCQLACCPNLETATINSDVLGESNFTCSTRLKTITFNGNITTIPRGFFQDCYSLKNIKIPQGVTSIEDSAFKGDSAVETIAIPKTVSNINRIFGILNSESTTPGKNNPDELYNGIIINYEGTETEWNAINKTGALPAGVTINYNYSY